MSRQIRRFVATCCLAVGLASFSAPAYAKQSPPGVLVCGTTQVPGQFSGSGVAFHTDDGRTFVVKYAKNERTGQVIVDVKGQQDKGLVTCSYLSPRNGDLFTFTGFFTSAS